MYINDNLKKIQVSVIRTLSQEMSKYDDSINLTIGEPAGDLPKDIKEFGANYLKNNKISYVAPGGIKELRKEYSKFYNKYFEGNYTEDECIINSGSTESISTFLKSVLKEGDEVILNLPIYPGYAPNVLLAGGKPVYVDTKSNGYKMSVDLIEKHITDKTKVIVIISPNNPTGEILSLEEMDKLAKIIEEKDIYLISDEIYSSLTFEKYYSFARYHHLKEKIIVINGMSKSHAMTGYRVGYTLTGKNLAQMLLKASQYFITGACTLSQHISLEAIRKYPIMYDEVKEYKEKIDYLYKEMTRLGFECIKPQGAFYLFANYEKITSKKSIDFCMDLIDKCHVGIVPSIAFNVENAIRISVNKDMETLKEFIRRLETYINKYCKE